MEIFDPAMKLDLTLSEPPSIVDPVTLGFTNSPQLSGPPIPIPPFTSPAPWAESVPCTNADSLTEIPELETKFPATEIELDTSCPAPMDTELLKTARSIAEIDPPAIMGYLTDNFPESATSDRIFVISTQGAVNKPQTSRSLSTLTWPVIATSLPNIAESPTERVLQLVMGPPSIV